MLTGDKIRLRAIERSDLPRFVAWLNDPEVRQGVSIYQPMSQAQEEGWYESTLKQPVQEQPLVIEIDTPQGWTPIGNISLMNLDWHARSAEVGIFIGEKQHWSQGYGRKAMELMLDMLFFQSIYTAYFCECLKRTRAPSAPMKRPALCMKGECALHIFKMGSILMYY
jgi:diamine N-acetyltransferase